MNTNINNFNGIFRLQLIHPIHGTKVYQATTFDNAVKKCYNELKENGNIPSDYFSVMNIDTFETFKFGINKNKNKIHNTQKGGDGSNIIKNNLDNIILNNVKTLSLDEISNRLLSLENKVNELESIIKNKK